MSSEAVAVVAGLQQIHALVAEHERLRHAIRRARQTGRAAAAAARAPSDAPGAADADGVPTHLRDEPPDFSQLAQRMLSEGEGGGVGGGVGGGASSASAPLANGRTDASALRMRTQQFGKHKLVPGGNLVSSSLGESTLTDRDKSRLSVAQID